MDSGIAAVLGSTVGAVGAGAAAFATGLWGARNARRQLDAQEAIAQRQLRVDHVRERREPRSKAYAEFIAQSHAVIDAINDELTPIREKVKKIHDELAKLALLEARVVVEGPDAIVEPALLVNRSARQCGFYAATVPGNPGSEEFIQRDYQMSFVQLEESLTIFADRARNALNADAVQAEEPGPLIRDLLGLDTYVDDDDEFPEGEPAARSGTS